MNEPNQTGVPRRPKIMLKLGFRPKLGGNRIPANVTTLSVSWLNNQFKAVAVHRGDVIGAWERPGDTEGPGDFEALIREAIHETGYHGQTVSLLLAHPRLVQQVVSMPPAKGAALQKLIHRQAQQQQMFAGEAAWASQTSPVASGMQNIVLHLFPRLLLNQFIQACTRLGLHLTGVLPASAVLQSQLTQLPLDKNDVGLLAAETAGSTTLVIGRNDGQILLARTVPDTWNLSSEHLAVALNRTLLFANQSYGVTLKDLWLFGPGAQQQCDTLQRHLQLPVRVSPVADETFYWATEAAKLAGELVPNFVIPKLRKAPQRRAFAKVVAAATAVVAIASLAASAYFYSEARETAGNIRALSSKIASLETRQAQLKQLDTELSRKNQVIKLVIGERPPPTPAWFLAYLGEAVPTELVVTNLQVIRDAELWRVKITGIPQQGVKQPQPPPLSASLAQLKTRLSASPFHLRIIEPMDPAAKPNQPAKASPGPRQSWIEQLTGAFQAKPAAREPQQLDHFVIEGVMR